MKFVNLHCHSEFSKLDGMSRVSEIVDYAKKMNGTHACITDHRTLSSCGFLHKECEKNGIIPIYAVEFNVIFDTESKDRGYHLCVLAKDRKGYENLCTLVSISNKKQNFYYVPRLPYNELQAHSDGLIVGTACIGGIAQRAILDESNPEKAKMILKLMQNDFGDDMYVEYQNHGMQQEQVVNEYFVPFANQLGIPIVATVDSHYSLLEDKEIHKVLLAMNYGKMLSDVKGFDGFGYHLLLEEELKNIFPMEYINNTVDIANKIKSDIFYTGLKLAPVYKGE